LQRTEVLIVAFAGGALRVGGEVQYEMQKTFKTFQCDQLYLLDPTGMSWYLQSPNNQWQGFQYYESKLKEYSQLYHYIIFTGSCLGATACLFFSHLCHEVICFNPQTDPSKDNRWSYWLGSRALPRHLRTTFLSLLENSIQRSSGSITIHSSNNIYERFQTSLLSHRANLKVIVHHECHHHSLAKYMKQRNMLLPLYNHAIQTWKMNRLNRDWK